MTLHEILHRLEENGLECLMMRTTAEEITDTPIHYAYLQRGIVLRISENVVNTLFTLGCAHEGVNLMWPDHDCSDLDGLANWLTVSATEFYTTGLAGFDESKLGRMMLNVNRMIA